MVPIIPARHGGGVARLGRACQVCPLQAACTSSPAGRTITIHPHQTRLQAARARQRDPAWRADYRAHRPIVERKLAHLLRRRHGGRRARMRGRLRVAQDWRLLAAAVNLARLPPWGCVQDRAGGPPPLLPDPEEPGRATADRSFHPDAPPSPARPSGATITRVREAHWAPGS
jgi:Transposase DDE domain